MTLRKRTVLFVFTNKTAISPSQCYKVNTNYIALFMLNVIDIDDVILKYNRHTFLNRQRMITKVKCKHFRLNNKGVVALFAIFFMLCDVKCRLIRNSKFHFVWDTLVRYAN